MGLWALLLMFGPMLGYWGARSLNATQVGCYLIFRIFDVVVRLSMFFAADDERQRVWAILLVICEIWITWEVYKFWNMLRNIDTASLMNAMEHARQRREAYGQVLY
jgi:hypothetical protein